MTLDELEKKIIEIKKLGLSPILEISKISDVRKEYYTQKIRQNQDVIKNRFFKNIHFLVAKYNSSPTKRNIKEFMGIDVDESYSKFYDQKQDIYNTKYVLIMSLYYGIPAELLLFHDLEIYGEQLKNNYPALLKQS